MSEHAPLDACPASTCKRMPYHRNGTLKERMITDGMCTVCSESHCTAGRAVLERLFLPEPGNFLRNRFGQDSSLPGE